MRVTEFLEGIQSASLLVANLASQIQADTKVMMLRMRVKLAEMHFTFSFTAQIDRKWRESSLRQSNGGSGGQKGSQDERIAPHRPERRGQVKAAWAPLLVFCAGELSRCANAAATTTNNKT